ncbi:cell filamentation protein Fic, partial [Pseudomonas sp. FW301-21B01]
PVSNAGLEVRAEVNRPLHERRPVGYNRAFLERYRPNQDAYLSQTQRERLHEWGRTSADVRPAGTYARDIMSRLLIDLSWASSRLEG